MLQRGGGTQELRIEPVTASLAYAPDNHSARLAATVRTERDTQDLGWTVSEVTML